MVSFLAGGEEAAVELVARTRIWTLAESLGGVESLIEHPGRDDPRVDRRLAVRGPRHLVRLSVGIEAADDLIADLEQALAGRQRGRPFLSGDVVGSPARPLGSARLSAGSHRNFRRHPMAVTTTTGAPAMRSRSSSYRAALGGAGVKVRGLANRRATTFLAQSLRSRSPRPATLHRCRRYLVTVRRAGPDVGFRPADGGAVGVGSLRNVHGQSGRAGVHRLGGPLADQVRVAHAVESSSEATPGDAGAGPRERDDLV